MKIDEVLASFDQVVDTPEAVPKLKQFILSLAVRGKLVLQDNKDEPASELLKKIAKEKKKLIEEGKIRQEKAFPSINDEEKPFQVPQSWEWVRLGETLEFEYGKPLSKSERHIHGKYPVYGANGEKTRSNKYYYDKPSIVVGRKGSAGAINLTKDKFWPLDVTYFVTFNKKEYDLIFLYYLLLNLNLPQLAKGIKPGLNRNDVYLIPTPLPPLTEQNRIVSKVNELMTLCDKLEASLTKREETRSSLILSSLARLNAPNSNKKTFLDDVRFMLKNFTTMTTRSEQIKEVRKAILSLAVRGKLVPQNGADEPASELLKKIAKEKKKLIEEGKIKQEKPFPSISDEEKPFKVPQGWEWVRLGEVGKLKSGGQYSYLKGTEDDIPFVKVGDMNIPANRVSICKSSNYYKYEDGIEQNLVPIQSIIFPKRGGAIATNKKRCILLEEILIDSNTMAVTIPIDIYFEYFYFWFKTIDLNNLGSGSVIPQINNKDINPIPIPLPPFAEQHRIVAKVNELMALCDKLEVSLTKREETRSDALNALLAEALKVT